MPIPTGIPLKRTIAIVAAAAWLVLPAAARAQDKVTITGGSDETGHNYSWTVNNHHTTAIVTVVFPHYQADLFVPPSGWESENTHMVATGEATSPGTCTAKVSNPADGIASGASATFTLRVGPRGAKRGSGDVLVRFADGTETTVVTEVPTRELFLGRYLGLVGLGVMFGIFLLYRLLRSPRTPAAGSTDGQA